MLNLLRSMRPFAALVLCWLTSAWGAAPPVITKVEPPNWWLDSSCNPVMLLVRGSGLAGAKLAPPHGLTVANLRTNDAGTYLFADVSMAPHLAPGDYSLQLHAASGDAVIPFRLEPPLDRSGHFTGFDTSDFIYLIMPDRFANGDPSNDNPAVSPNLFDRRNPHFYHGGDFAGIAAHLPYFKSLGVTALWLTPVYDNTNKINNRQAVNGPGIADYHGYGTVDYYGVEEHLGNMNSLRKLIDEAHAAGLKVIQDQVANHVGPGHPWVKESPKPTWFHGTAENHIDETWQLFTLTDPHAAAPLQHAVVDGWFANALPDMNQEDPDVARYEIQNTLWWMASAGFDAIRQDTLPYVGRPFWSAWSQALKREYPNTSVVGEVFDSDPAVPSFFQGGRRQADGIDTGIDSVFDFPLFSNLREVFIKNADLSILPIAFAKDRFYPDPSRLVTFLGNHDTTRFMSEQGATVDSLKRALTIMFSVRGIPSIYSGDEIAMRGGVDPDNRRDFPGGWPGDRHSAFTAQDRSREENDVFNNIAKLAALRRVSRALRQGSQTDLAVVPGAWVFAREKDGEQVLVAVNNVDHSVAVTFRLSGDRAYLGQLGSVHSLTVHDGVATVSLPARSAEIFLASQ